MRLLLHTNEVLLWSWPPIPLFTVLLFLYSLISYFDWLASWFFGSGGQNQVTCCDMLYHGVWLSEYHCKIISVGDEIDHFDVNQVEMPRLLISAMTVSLCFDHCIIVSTSYQLSNLFWVVTSYYEPLYRLAYWLMMSYLSLGIHTTRLQECHHTVIQSSCTQN